MPLHLYCIVPAGRVIPAGRTGIASTPLISIAAGNLAAWVTEHQDAVAASVDVLRIHNDVIAAAMDETVTPVPLRFGQSAPGHDEVAALISTDAAKWSALLDRFAGHAEYGVRAVRDDTDIDAEQDVHTAQAESGTQYMAALARRHAQVSGRRSEGERIAQAVEARIGELATDTRIEYGAAGPVLVSVAHLVAWSVAARYHGAMAEVRKGPGDARFVTSGPWPPWSFVV